MDKSYFLNQSTSLTLVVVISLIFVFLGLYNSKKYQGLTTLTSHMIIDYMQNLT